MRGVVKGKNTTVDLCVGAPCLLRVSVAVHRLGSEASVMGLAITHPMILIEVWVLVVPASPTTAAHALPHPFS